MKNFVQAILVILGQIVVFNKITPNENYKNSLLNSPMLVLIAFIGLIYLFKFVGKLKIKTSLLQKVVSAFFAICTWFMTVYFGGISTVSEVIKYPIGVIYSILFVLSFYILVETFQKILTHYYHHKLIENSQTNKLITIFEKHSFLFPFILFSFVWLLIAVSAYPSTFMGDSLSQLKQYFAISPRKAGHPVLSTVFIGNFVKFGRLIGHPNLGLFLYTTCQIIFVALCLSYAINLTYKLTKKGRLLVIITVILTVIPMVNGTIILATKDIMFSGFFILYMMSLIVYFYNYTYFMGHKLYLLNLISVVFMMLYRYNTLQFVGLTIVVYIIGGLIMKKKFYKITSITIMMILGLIIGNVGNKLLTSMYVEEQPTPNRREMLSLPFQHTARFAKYYNNEVSSNDKQVINKVLDYDSIRKNYDPYRSDIVKATHNEDATSQEMKEYFTVVLKQIRKRPLLAVESVMASHSNLFNLNQSLNGYYYNGVYMSGNQDEKENAAKIGIHDNQTALKLNSIRVKLYRIFDRLPILSQIDNYAFYILIMLSVFVLWLRERQFYLVGMVIPMGAFIGTLIAGPITLGYIRYILPIILVAPFLLIFCLSTKDLPSNDKAESCRKNRRR